MRARLFGADLSYGTEPVFHVERLCNFAVLDGLDVDCHDPEALAECGTPKSSPLAKAPDSKGKTVAAAAKLFRQQGYHGTALHDILAAGGSPRGSLYFHFPKGKEEIGEAALTLAGEAVRQAIAHAAEASESAEIFLVRIVRGMAADLERSDYREGCPIATTALETAAQSEVLGAATRTAFKNGKAKSNAG